MIDCSISWATRGSDATAKSGIGANATYDKIQHARIINLKCVHNTDLEQCTVNAEPTNAHTKSISHDLPSRLLLRIDRTRQML